MQRLCLPLPLSTLAALAAVLAGVQAAAGAQEPRQPPRPVELAEVRAVFQRVDADGDGRLARREADHGGVGAEDFTRFDEDADGALDREEFTVARNSLPGAGGRSSAPDLVAEATRIQAAWRARRALERHRGPSASRTLAAGTPQRTPPPQTTTSTATRAAVASYPLEMAGGLPPALGLSRLRGAGPFTPAARRELTLEERARVAQELIQARLRDRNEVAATSLVVSVRPGPGSRAQASQRVGESRAGPARPTPKPTRPSGERAPSRDAPRATAPAGPGAGRSRSAPVQGRGGGGQR